MRTWAIAAVWLTWLLLAGGVGVARSKLGDKVDDRGTRICADAMTIVSMVGSIVAAFRVPWAAISADRWATLALGSALVASGIALRCWAAKTLGRFFTQSVTICEGHQVIASGPYRLVRHPGYTGMLLSLIGLGLTLGNWLSVTIMLIGFLAGHLPRIKVEASVLEENLGDDYKTYERSRKRFIPWVW